MCEILNPRGVHAPRRLGHAPHLRSCSCTALCHGELRCIDDLVDALPGFRPVVLRIGNGLSTFQTRMAAQRSPGHPLTCLQLIRGARPGFLSVSVGTLRTTAPWATGRRLGPSTGARCDHRRPSRKASVFMGQVPVPARAETRARAASQWSASMGTVRMASGTPRLKRMNWTKNLIGSYLRLE